MKFGRLEVSSKIPKIHKSTSSRSWKYTTSIGETCFFPVFGAFFSTYTIQLYSFLVRADIVYWVNIISHPTVLWILFAGRKYLASFVLCTCSITSVEEIRLVFGGGPSLKVALTLGSKTRKTPKSSDPIGQELNSGPKEFMLGSGSKVWKMEVVLMWHRFCQISAVLSQDNTRPSLRNQSSSLGVILSPKQGPQSGVWDPKCLGPGP